jgi:hypothetical protein
MQTSDPVTDDKTRAARLEARLSVEQKRCYNRLPRYPGAP